MASKNDGARSATARGVPPICIQSTATSLMPRSARRTPFSPTRHALAATGTDTTCQPAARSTSAAAPALSATDSRAGRRLCTRSAIAPACAAASSSSGTVSAALRSTIATWTPSCLSPSRQPAPRLPRRRGWA